MTYREALAALGGAQKVAARGAPAYSRFVNRRLGRFLAAGAAVAGMTPNAVTAVSALFTFSGIAVLAFSPLGALTGVVVALLLVIGYALDSADGQLARLRGGGSPAGEWLDHVVDAIKVSSLPLGVLVALSRTDLPDWVLVVPLVATVVQAVSFFTMILTEQLRRAHGTVPVAAAAGAGAWLRSAVAIPTDYGVQCLLFVLLGALWPFVIAYTVVIAASAGYLLLALVKWYRELRALPGVRG